MIRTLLGATVILQHVRVVLPVASDRNPSELDNFEKNHRHPRDMDNSLGQRLNSSLRCSTRS